MAYNFLPAERDQLYLMPPSLRDWLSKDHLALFVLDVVDELDLSGFYERYRSDGLGRAAYEPSVMVCVLLYAHCVGERSSRRIERRCTEDIAWRVLSVDQVPDDATIARFLASHEEVLVAPGISERVRLAIQPPRRPASDVPVAAPASSSAR
jgi:transposase